MAAKASVKKKAGKDVFKKPTSNKRLLWSVVIGVIVLTIAGVVAYGYGMFDTRASAAKKKTQDQIRKELRGKSEEGDCTKSGGDWILVGNRNTGKGYCRPKKEVKPTKPTTKPQLQQVP